MCKLFNFHVTIHQASFKWSDKNFFHNEINSFMFLTHDMNIVYEIHHMKINNRLDNNK